MRHIKQLHFPVQATRHQNVLSRVEIDRANYRLMLVPKVGIHQFLELELSWLENSLVFLKYARVGLKQLLNRV